MDNLAEKIRNAKQIYNQAALDTLKRLEQIRQSQQPTTPPEKKKKKG